MDKRIESLEELEVEALTFATSLAPQKYATLVTLSGELGAGKTAFTKMLAKAFGIEEHITSPTFVLEKIYKLPEGKNFKRLAHIDAYRLKDGSELSALGFDELMSNPETLVILEWPEMVSDMLPAPAHRITLSVNTDNSRTIRYE
jgi:tRNA threonylcarbamoyladenosine biosynthesis protein TsaE